MANKEKRIEELEREMEAPDFWDDAEESQKKMKELKYMKDDLQTYENLRTQMAVSYTHLTLPTICSV